MSRDGRSCLGRRCLGIRDYASLGSSKISRTHARTASEHSSILRSDRSISSRRRASSFSPAIERDLALVVPIGNSAAELDGLIRDCGGTLLESLELFDLYLDLEKDGGVQSLAFRLRFRAEDRTLKDKEVDRSVDLILRRLKEELNVEPRR
ncbi:MAG TPA: hypothetical protein EYN99_00160 [Gemmatimonadetes bacterium]|nr:hypothetical protein [Gemmatimonadota bacterium]